MSTVETKKRSWGGARKNSGRKKAEGVRHMYTIPDDVATWIKKHGEGAYIAKVIRDIIQREKP